MGLPNCKSGVIVKPCSETLPITIPRAIPITIPEALKRALPKTDTGKGRMGLHKKRFLPEEKTIHFIQKRRTHYEKETFKRIT